MITEWIGKKIQDADNLEDIENYNKLKSMWDEREPEILIDKAIMISAGSNFYSDLFYGALFVVSIAIMVANEVFQVRG